MSDGFGGFGGGSFGGGGASGTWWPERQPTTWIKHVRIGVATLSWIDLRSGLPEFDWRPPPDQTNADQIRHAKICRFSNLLEVKAIVDTKDRAILSVTTNNSAMFMRPSFLGTRPAVVGSNRRFHREETGGRMTTVRISQVVGCRTRAPEKIANTLEKLVSPPPLPNSGEEIVEALGLVYPPIWTELAITITADARTGASLIGHSLFPSMSYYVDADGSDRYLKRSPDFHAVPLLPAWKKYGWGPRLSPTGPSAGNPWKMPNPAGVFSKDG
jgi:hypothetical protein